MADAFQKTILPSASRTATQNGDTIATKGNKTAHLVIDITVNAGGLGSLVVTIQGFDKASGKYYTILASAALTAVATTVLRVGPALTAAANLVANDALPGLIRVIVVGNANPVTFSVGLSLQ